VIHGSLYYCCTISFPFISGFPVILDAMKPCSFYHHLMIPIHQLLNFGPCFFFLCFTIDMQSYSLPKLFSSLSEVFLENLLMYKFSKNLLIEVALNEQC
jgi:hypothetical protein